MIGSHKMENIPYEVLTITDSSSNSALDRPSSLTYDASSKKLFWINLGTGVIQFYVQDTNDLKSLSPIDLPIASPTYYGLGVYDNYLYFGANEILYRRHFRSTDVEKVTSLGLEHANNVIVYSQRNTLRNPCSDSDCAHLCLPLSNEQMSCACANGYKIDPQDDTICVADSEILVYTSRKGLVGLSFLPNNSLHEGGLPMISGLGSIDRVAVDPGRSIIVVGNTQEGFITQMWRDGSHKKVLVSGTRYYDIAVDWSTGNIFWSSVRSISVCKLHDARQYVILHDINQPKHLAPHPGNGEIYWSDGSDHGSIYRAKFDGSGVEQIASNIGDVNGIALDFEQNFLYVTEPAFNKIVAINTLTLKEIVVVTDPLTVFKSLAVRKSLLYVVQS